MQDEPSGEHAGLAGQANVSMDEVLLKVVQLLRPLDNEVRCRVVQAALTFLGTSISSLGPAMTSDGPSGVDGEIPSDSGDDISRLPRRAQIWLRQNSLDFGALTGIFHRSGSGLELIAHDLPAGTDKERVQQCYLLAGLRTFLMGESGFEDEVARGFCRDMGCYNKGNHATYVKAIGNLMAGSKSGTYELTQPGLRQAAELVRSMSNGA